jgi:hypothetical protein
MPSPTVPTIQYGGYFLLTSLMNKGSRYMDNPLRQNFFRAGHAHAGVIVILSLVTERGRSLDFIEWQYKNAVLPAARRYLLPSKGFANLVLDSNADIATVEKNLYDAIVEKLVLARVR